MPTCKARLRKLLRALVRYAFLVVLAGSLVGQPVLAHISEIHDLAHATLEHDHDGARSSDEQDGEGGVLQVMHHLAHCCGATAAMPQSPLFVGAAPLRSAAPAGVAPIAHDDRRSLTPFRPPIAG